MAHKILIPTSAVLNLKALLVKLKDQHKCRALNYHKVIKALYDGHISMIYFQSTDVLQ